MLYFSLGFQQLLAQAFDAFAGDARHCNQRCIGIGAGGQQGANLLVYGFDPGAIDPVTFVDRNDCPGNAQQFDNRQMLAGLRHHPIIGSHHQQHQINALGASQHVVSEAFMTGHVDETGQARSRLQRRIEITEVDGHAAFAFFPASVTGLSGERLE
ncbi:hypothetical protein D3C81_1623500 [compost metagenome]